MKDELEQRWRDLGEFIRDQRRVGHLSLRKLSEMAGISNPYLSQIERGLRKPSAEILRQIAGALEISSETLYVRAGILDEREDVADLPAEIRRDPYLSEDQKRTLIQVYESFRRERATPAGAGDGPAPDGGGPSRPAAHHTSDAEGGSPEGDAVAGDIAPKESTPRRRR